MFLADHGPIVLKGPNSGNVVQSCCVDPETGLFWAQHTDGNIVLTVAKVRPDKPVAHLSGQALGHGQAFVPIGNGRFICDSDTPGNLRVVRLDYTGGQISLSGIRKVEVFASPHSNLTFTDGGPNETHVAVRGKRTSDGESVIKFFDRAEFMAWAKGGAQPNHTAKFVSDVPKGQWFQGCCVYRGHLITWRGDSDTNTSKILRKYDLSGNFLDARTFNLFAKQARQRGSKYEPEGLFTHRGDLFALFCQGQDGANLKYYVNLSRYLPGWL